mmetsp:Transcript_24398/g.68415  ORF Transcript_24398/g.68415 Transcript_24398/m.68415 type:complete len:229 (-) Transcript_24398:1422-2108(-)
MGGRLSDPSLARCGRQVLPRDLRAEALFAIDQSGVEQGLQQSIPIDHFRRSNDVLSRLVRLVVVPQCSDFGERDAPDEENHNHLAVVVELSRRPQVLSRLAGGALRHLKRLRIQKRKLIRHCVPPWFEQRLHQPDTERCVPGIHVRHIIGLLFIDVLLDKIECFPELQKGPLTTFRFAKKSDRLQRADRRGVLVPIRLQNIPNDDIVLLGPQPLPRVTLNHQQPQNLQ